MAANFDRAVIVNRAVIIFYPGILLDKKYTIINFVDKTFPSWYFNFVSKHTYVYVSKIVQPMLKTENAKRTNIKLNISS